MFRRITAGVCALALTLAWAGPVAAHDCFVAKKPASAGAAYDVQFGPQGPTFTPLKNNPGTPGQMHGGFATVDGSSTFVHAPDGVLPPAREGGAQYDCDGKGLDAFSACP